MILLAPEFKSKFYFILHKSGFYKSMEDHRLQKWHGNLNKSRNWHSFRFGLEKVLSNYDILDILLTVLYLMSLSIMRESEINSDLWSLHDGAAGSALIQSEMVRRIALSRKHSHLCFWLVAAIGPWITSRKYSITPSDKREGAIKLIDIRIAVPAEHEFHKATVLFIY